MTGGVPAVTELASVRHDLLQSLNGLKEQQCRARPEAGAWSIQEYLGYVIARERHLAAALRREDADLPVMTDEQRTAAAQRANELMLPALIHDLNAARNDSLRALEHAPPALAGRAIESLLAGDRACAANIVRNCELLGVR